MNTCIAVLPVLVTVIGTVTGSPGATWVLELSGTPVAVTFGALSDTVPVNVPAVVVPPTGFSVRNVNTYLPGSGSLLFSTPFAFWDGTCCAIA